MARISNSIHHFYGRFRFDFSLIPVNVYVIVFTGDTADSQDRGSTLALNLTVTLCNRLSTCVVELHARYMQLIVSNNLQLLIIHLPLMYITVLSFRLYACVGLRRWLSNNEQLTLPTSPPPYAEPFRSIRRSPLYEVVDDVITAKTSTGQWRTALLRRWAELLVRESIAGIVFPTQLTVSKLYRLSHSYRW